MKRVGTSLIIGYGNPLLGDDAAGHHVVAALARRGLARTTLLTVHQLTPELATMIAEVDRVIFVDARVGRGGVRWEAISGSEGVPPSTRAMQAGRVRSQAGLTMHLSEPSALLALAHVLYAHAPRAYLVTLPAHDFSLGAPLSSVTRRAVPLACRLIRTHLCHASASSRSSSFWPSSSPPVPMKKRR
ncbi:hydrogenase maturation protease [Oscillochloris trichoides DG-6]|uniref:Hydrogenase maturation protease n=1 Tax=Oscillochloris trichoides DG-6 TaxID=765420 RepID=E1IF12_9CHLR|nr:hydrogenase maturation protease [Oscillochloris trichoides]EFO80216.1 hydrogenase maturation protease [Oscillochloris trichoides DG-6]